MGIGPIFKTLEFDGENSGDYGLYISGEGVFNAPQRDVEMVTIPGRNGSFVLDHGRFENIEVVYPAGVFGQNADDFADKIAQIRAWLCSKKGYVRLTDEYNPNEYRMAVYKSGLDVDPALLRAGEFDLVFDCMPQRFLTSGETPVDIASSGDTITNPTLFNARPLLLVSGTGKLAINGNEMQIVSSAVGLVTLLSNWYDYGESGGSVSWAINPGYDLVNNGDPVYINAGTITIYFYRTRSMMIGAYSTDDFITDANTNGTDQITLSISKNVFDRFTFNKGTAYTNTTTIPFNYFTDNGIPKSDIITVTVSVNAAGTISINVSLLLSANEFRLYLSKITADSSQSTLGNPLYLDLDIGEAYKIENDEIISVNSGVILGTELAELKPGANEITFDNTITELKIVPRWWTV